MIIPFLDRLEQSDVPLARQLRAAYMQWRVGSNRDFEAILANSRPETRKRLGADGATKGSVLFFSPRDWKIHEAWETVMMYAVRAAGYLPETVVCFHGMKSCENYEMEREPGSICPWCAFRHDKRMRLNGFPVHRYEDLIDAPGILREARRLVGSLDLASCLTFVYRGVPLGYLTEMSVIRNCRSSKLDGDAEALRMFRSYLEGAVLTTHVAEKLLERPWELIVLLNGKFFAEAIVQHMARAKGLPVMTYERGFHPGELLFSVNGFANDFPVAQQFRGVSHLELNEAQSREVDRLLMLRRTGKATVISYFPTMNEDIARIRGELGLREGVPTTVAFPNILWDTAVFRRDTAFNGLWDWIRSTIDYHIARPDRQLIVRVHPAEVRLHIQTREQVGERIRTNYPTLPPNVKIVPATSDISSYLLMDLSDRVVVYSSTMGLEGAAAGRQVITAGMTHYRKLGFTRDAETRAEYEALLDSQPRPLTEAERQVARRYFYYFCQNFSWKVRSVTEPRFGFAQYTFRSLDELLASDCGLVTLFRDRLFPLSEGCPLVAPGSLGPDSPLP